MSRIAIGGVQHETNTFAATRATFDDFVHADAWPGLCRGAALIEAVKGINLPIAGFIDQARADGHTLKPLVWCSAQPSGPVTRDAFERIAFILLEDLAAALPVDAVYLDLHGAMVAEHLDDADGELLARVRERVGAAVPVVASLDLHANVSQAMLEQASALVAYRNYPHTDMAQTGARAAQLVPKAHRPRPVEARAQASRLPDSAHRSVHAHRARSRPDGARGRTGTGACARIALHAGISAGRRARLRAVRVRLRHSKSSPCVTQSKLLAAEVAAAQSDLGGRFWTIDAAVRRALEPRPSAGRASDSRRYPGQSRRGR